MKTRFGKITLSVIAVLLLAIGITTMMVCQAKAAIDTGTSYDFPLTNTAFDGYALLYYKVFDIDSGKCLDVTLNDGSGGFGASVTWANSAVQTGITWNITHKVGFLKLPEILENKKYLILAYGSSDATPDSADTLIAKGVISWSGNSLIGWPAIF